jgi:uncharacterized protein
MANMVKVLSIDGGGIRGIIPAMVLMEIERRTQRPIATLFDLVAGTSTGGILALGLTKPDVQGRPEHSAESLLGLYENEGAKIFSRSVWHRIHSVGSAVEEKYASAPVEALLSAYFGDTRLSEALVEVLVSSYEIERRIPWFFKRRLAREMGGGWDLMMKQVARATSAAPTYFEPVRIAMQDRRDYYALIDGGVYANNPAMCAYVEARGLYQDADDFLVVSLGTGGLTRRLPYDDATGWGLVGWARPLLSVVFDGVSSTVDYQLNVLLNREEAQPRYYRFQARLDEGSDDMDDASRGNCRVLRLLGEDIVKRQDREIDRLCEQLVAQ